MNELQFRPIEYLNKMYSVSKYITVFYDEQLLCTVINWAINDSYKSGNRDAIFSIEKGCESLKHFIGDYCYLHK